MNVIQVTDEDVICIEKKGVWAWRIRLKVFHNDKEISSLRPVDNEFLLRRIGGKELRIDSSYVWYSGKVRIRVHVDGELVYDSKRPRTKDGKD